ncbi:ECF transporter S component [Bifidobacterium amazonense]|uniref:ECF transporter S component n=1 Tax=Bifidobacterium amazonense TaxID=2809027 RepID=A0ABS9VUM1_9BIFI|nr:ECF transporter S component [Bifidobacterium amazonense]MCH9275792.1 ECF transporter S component [Bifidobacterium amazonense]
MSGKADATSPTNRSIVNQTSARTAPAGISDTAAADAVSAIDDLSRLRWKPQDIAVGAALGVACGLVFWAFDFAYTPVSSLLSAILPGLMSLFHGFWYFSGPLALLILRKPGAAVYVNLVGALAEALIGNRFSIVSILIAALLEGISADIPFLLTRYRRFSLPMSIASGAFTALTYGLYLLFFYFQGVAPFSPRGIVHMISEMIGGVLIAGVMSWFLYLAIGRTGVLDRLASGRDLPGRKIVDA